MNASPQTVDLNRNTLARGYFSGVGEDLTGLNASNLSGGTVDPARLGSGTPSAATFLRGDGTWAVPAGGGGSSPGGFKNILMGGDFSTNPWQRGTSFNLAGATGPVYTADRWFGGFDLGQAYTISRQTGIGLTGFSASIRSQRNSGSTANDPNWICQVVESVNVVPLQGQTMAFSFWARVGANFSGGSLSVVIGSGTVADQGAFLMLSGGWTGVAFLVVTAQAITTGWTRYSMVFTVPTDALELSVKLGYNNSTGTAGANDWFEIAGVQLEVGSAATSFEALPPDFVASHCQRYYRITSIDSPRGNIVGGLSGTAAATTTLNVGLTFPPSRSSTTARSMRSAIPPRVRR